MMIKKLLLVICFLRLVSNGFAQSVYTLDLKKDIITGSLSLGLALSPFFLKNEPDQIPSLLGKNDVNVFDRPLMFQYNRLLDNISDYGVYGLLALPAISIIGKSAGNTTLLTYGIMYAEAFLLTLGTKDILKNAIIRYRPYMYSYEIPGGKENDYYNSFPSGSTAYAFLGATFLSTTFSKEYPESRWKLPITIGSYTLATGIASMRIISGSHFLSDVLVGAAIGTFYGWAVPVLHENNNGNNLSINLTGNKIMVSLRL